MTTRKSHNDGRLRIWLPEDKRWIRDALAHVEALNEHRGFPSSISATAVSILEKELEWFHKEKASDASGDPTKEG